MAPKAPAQVPAPPRDDAHDEIQPDEGNESDAGSRDFFPIFFDLNPRYKNLGSERDLNPKLKPHRPETLSR